MDYDSPPTDKTIMTIPSGHAFLARLAETLLHDRTLGGAFGAAGGNTFELHDFTVFLPTRRAVRALQSAFLKQAETDALRLPDIRSLGDTDEGVLAFSTQNTDIFDLPPCLPSIERESILMELVLKWGKKTGRLDNAVQAAALASDLAAFLDNAQTEEIDLLKLENIVPDGFSANWQQTLDFLDIITHNWPAIKKEKGVIDPPQARQHMLQLQTDMVCQRAPNLLRPVIAAGSTGSIPATARLLAAIAAAPFGAVVVPGLDTEMSSAAWAQLKDTPSHPQAGLFHLLQHLAISRRDVTLWPSCCGRTKTAQTDRRRFLNAALLPANQTREWISAPEGAGVYDIKEALKGLTYLEADETSEEAGLIALALREVLATPDKTAILVTPDRQLARRVSAEMLQWDVEIDDTAGAPLSNQPGGRFVRAVLETVMQGFAPVSLMAVLKHEMAHMGLSRTDYLSLIRQFEHVLLRGPAPASGFDGLRAHAEAQLNNKRKKKYWQVIENDLLPLIEKLAQHFAPLTLLQRAASLKDIAAALRASCEKLTIDDAGLLHIFAGIDGEILHDFMTEVSLIDTKPVNRSDWTGLFTHWLAQRPVRRPFGLHPRLSIMGLLEARLVQADLVILGGLNEGVWPGLPDTGPWVSRPMREDISMTSPERSIGLMAHDFVQSAASAQVILTRSKKQGGRPMVAARWITRMTAIVKGKLGSQAKLPDNEKLHHYWHQRNPTRATSQHPDEQNWQGANHKPMPRPDAALRPKKLSVTRVQKLQSNPYAIYAQYVLGLEKLDPLEADMTVAMRGSFVHKVLEVFVKAYPDELPENPAEVMQKMARELAETEPGGRDILTFWWSRFVALSEWFTSFEQRRRAPIEQIWLEQYGRLNLKIKDRAFSLTGIADRIEKNHHGKLTIIDYKTGALPSSSDVKNHRDSQMPLLGLMAERGGFPDIPAGKINELSYVRANGGYPAGETQDIENAQELMAAVMDGLVQLLETFADSDMPYVPHIRPKLIKYADDYAHLARVKEWSSGGDEEES